MQVVAGGQVARATGPISALWEWDQDANHHQAQLHTCTQFGPNPPVSLGAGIRQTNRQTGVVVTDRRSDRLQLCELSLITNVPICYCHFILTHN